MEMAEQVAQCATGQEEGGHGCATTNELSAYRARQHSTSAKQPCKARLNYNCKRACQCPWEASSDHTSWTLHLAKGVPE
jgi:hypothetical protein